VQLNRWLQLIHLNVLAQNSQTVADADLNDLHRVEYYSPGGLLCNAGGLMPDSKIIIQGQYKTTARITDSDAIKGEATIETSLAAVL